MSDAELGNFPTATSGARYSAGMPDRSGGEPVAVDDADLAANEIGGRGAEVQRRHDCIRAHVVLELRVL